MNQAGSNELWSIKRELQSVIEELEDIANGVQHDFSGIGNERCASSIRNGIGRYRRGLRKLNNLDTKTVTEEYAKAHAND